MAQVEASNRVLACIRIASSLSGPESPLSPVSGPDSYHPNRSPVVSAGVPASYLGSWTVTTGPQFPVGVPFPPTIPNGSDHSLPTTREAVCRQVCAKS